MFDRDTWTGVNGKTHDGPHLRVASRHDDDLGCYCLYNHQGEPGNLETIPIGA